MAYDGLIRRLALLTLILFLQGCGGGGSSTNSSSGDTPPPDSQNGNGTLLSESSAFNPSVAVAQIGSHLNVYVVWEQPGGQSQFGNSIYFARSRNGGVDFDPPEGLFDAAPGGGRPVIAAQDNLVFLIWNAPATQGTGELQFSFSNNEGETFTTPPTRIANLVSELQRPTLAVSNLFIHASWFVRGVSESSILYRRSRIFENDFEKDESLNPSVILSESGAANGSPSIGVNGANIYVVWEDLLSRDNQNTDQLDDILLVRSSDEGDTFSESPLNLSNDPLNLTNSISPKIAVAGEKIYVIWEEISPQGFILSRSLDAGDNFSSDRLTSISPIESTNGELGIAADGNHLFIVWASSAGGSRQVQYSASANPGSGFSAPVNISQNKCSARNPAVATAGGAAYIVWEGQFAPLGDCNSQDVQQRIYFYKP